MGDQDMSKLATELWVSLAKFERMIAEESRGYKVEHDALRHRSAKHIEFVKENANFRIQSLESALIELKLNSRKEIDRLNMTLEDINSQAYNRTRPKTQATDLMK